MNPEACVPLAVIVLGKGMSDRFNGAFFFTTTIRSVGYHQELEAVYASVPSIIEETPQAVLQHTHPAVDTT